MSSQKGADAPQRGRPTKYDPAYCEEVINMGKEGKSLAQMCAHFDISRQTINNWADSYPDFLEALSRAQAHAQAWWEDQGAKGMWADKFNAVVWKKSVEARFRDDYTERQEIDLSLVDPDQAKARLAELLGKARGDDAGG